MSVLWQSLQAHVREFPTECVQTLLRWFSGDRTGITVWNVIECTLVLSAYFVGQVAQQTTDEIRTFGDVPANATTPLTLSEQALLLELEAVLVQRTGERVSGVIGSWVALWAVRRVLVAVLDQLQAEYPQLAETIAEIRQWLDI